jgi:hypothetical protein
MSGLLMLLIFTREWLGLGMTSIPPTRRVLRASPNRKLTRLASYQAISASQAKPPSARSRDVKT